MTISTHITRPAKAIALGLALVALAVPAAQAGDRRPRDTGVDAATILPQDFRGDDYFRDGNRDAAYEQVPVDGWYNGLMASTSPETVLPQDFRGVDWYRDAKSVPAEPQTILPQDFRGDDYFRDRMRNAAPQSSTDGFGWRDFGIGASSMLGALALLGALSSIALTARRGSRRLRRI
jgi:hypothetical protein